MGRYLEELSPRVKGKPPVQPPHLVFLDEAEAVEAAEAEVDHVSARRYFELGCRLAGIWRAGPPACFVC